MKNVFTKKIVVLIFCFFLFNLTQKYVVGVTISRLLTFSLPIFCLLLFDYRKAIYWRYGESVFWMGVCVCFFTTLFIGQFSFDLITLLVCLVILFVSSRFSSESFESCLSFLIFLGFFSIFISIGNGVFTHTRGDGNLNFLEEGTIIGVSMILVLCLKRPWVRKLRALFVVLSVCVVFYAELRGVLVSLLVSLVYYLSMSGRLNFRNAMLVACSAAVSVYIFTTGERFQRLLFDFASEPRLEKIVYFFGLDQTDLLFPKYIGYYKTFFDNHPHNFIIQSVLDFGWILSAVFILVLSFGLLASNAKYRADSAVYISNLILVFVLVQSCFSYNLYSNYLLFLVLGLSWSSKRNYIFESINAVKERS